MRSHCSTRMLTLLLPLAVALGCTTTVDLKIDDNDRFTPSGRVSYEIWPGNDTRRRGTLLDLVWPSASSDPAQAVTVRNSGIRPTISIDGAFARVESRDTQDLALGEEVDVGVSIVGPATLDLEAENLRGHLAARGGVRFYDVLSIEAITRPRTASSQPSSRHPSSCTTSPRCESWAMRPPPGRDLMVPHAEDPGPHGPSRRPLVRTIRWCRRLSPASVAGGGTYECRRASGFRSSSPRSAQVVRDQCQASQRGTSTQAEAIRLAMLRGNAMRAGGSAALRAVNSRG